MKLRPKLITIVFLFFSILTSIWLYRDSIESYFFQDDWFSFRIARAGNLAEFLKFFVPRKDVIYYRPLGMQVPFNLLHNIFGVESRPFRLLTFITHSLNIILVYVLFYLLTNKRKLSIIGAIFYATSSIFFIPFFWFSTYSFILAPSFYFLSFILFLYFQKKDRIRYLISSYIFFFVGLLTNELIMTLPILLFLYVYLAKIKKKVFYIFPYIILDAFLIILRFTFFSVPIRDSYKLDFGWNVLSNLKTYILWSFNWSEIVTEQMTRPFIFNDFLMKEFSIYVHVTVVLFVFIFSCFISGLILWLRKDKSGLCRKQVLFGSAWFIIGLLPVIFFKEHKFSYYLPVSLVGLFLVFVPSIYMINTFLVNKVKFMSSFFLVIIFMSWFTVSFMTIELNKKLHWAINRAKISEYIIKDIFKKRDAVGNSKFSVLDTSENRLSLNNQDAVKFLFGNDSEVIYVKVK